MRRTPAIPAAAVLSLLLVACGGAGDDPTASSGGDPGGDPVLVIADGAITEPGMSVADALSHRATDDLVTVSGALFVDTDGIVRLCEYRLNAVLEGTDDPRLSRIRAAARGSKRRR